MKQRVNNGSCDGLMQFDAASCLCCSPLHRVSPDLSSVCFTSSVLNLGQTFRDFITSSFHCFSTRRRCFQFSLQLSNSNDAAPVWGVTDLYWAEFILQSVRASLIPVTLTVSSSQVVKVNHILFTVSHVGTQTTDSMFFTLCCVTLAAFHWSSARHVWYQWKLWDLG